MLRLPKRFQSTPICSAETVFLRRRDGQAKVAGVVACVSGALIMAVYRGAPVFGSDETIGVHAAGRSALMDPEDISYTGRSLASYGMSWWHLGVVCLIGNCMSMSAYLAVQASTKIHCAKWVQTMIYLRSFL
jgi:hypothetical protein